MKKMYTDIFGSQLLSKTFDIFNIFILFPFFVLGWVPAEERRRVRQQHIWRRALRVRRPDQWHQEDPPRQQDADAEDDEEGGVQRISQEVGDEHSIVE